jgi:glutamate--cysteine ligase
MRDLQATPSPDAVPVEGEADLVAHFHRACKPRDRFRVGTEHELIGVSVAESDAGLAYGSAIPYDGERGIRALLGRLERRGWTPIVESGNVIGMARGDAQVTLEPGGQLELAGRPVTHASEFADDSRDFMRDVSEASRALELRWLCVGFRPFQTLDEVPWVPKGRYAIMREYLPTRGRLAHEMMKRTATVQVNLDYADMEDARATLRASMAVTSILTAIYANSPIVDEKPSEYQSYRAAIWRETDPDRCGILPLAFEDVDVFEAYTQWALDVPMFFVHRERYVAAHGVTFRQFLRNGFDGARATLDDWALHLSTLFPEARMKGYIEVRSCDAGSAPMVVALGPLCRGFLYDTDARAAATALTDGLDIAQRDQLTVEVARHGLRATLPDGRRVADLARELVAISEAGLRAQVPEELPFLDPVREIVDSERTQADRVLEVWQRTGGDRARVIAELSHRLDD